jgi:hypothetical protein
LLVAAPGNAIQHAIAVHVLSVFRIEEHQEAFEDADRSNAKQHGAKDKQDVTEAHAGHKWSGQQSQSSNQEEGANYAGRINAVIGFCWGSGHRSSVGFERNRTPKGRKSERGIGMEEH